MENREAKLKEYAKLLIEVGLKVRKGQTLVLSSPVDCAEFARMCASAAYDVGCREVIMDWHDGLCAREKYLRAEDSVFDDFPKWRAEFFNHYADLGAASLHIGGSDPELFKGVDPQRFVRAERAAEKPLEKARHMQMANIVPWCIAAIPVPSWAKKVFPGISEEDAMEKLWDAILTTMRITGDGKAVERWNEHINLLNTRRDKLNEYHFKSLHYTNSLGTDLVIELPKDHLWAACGASTPEGQVFIANMPTEEIFTAPLSTGINGVVYAALPLVSGGNIIDGFHFVVKDGKIVECHAEKGEEYLKADISLDEGASYFGEVALVPYDSTISNLGVLFYDTLFDENARCHLAFGEAYPECIEGGQDMSPEELQAHGLNYSMQHEDFMVGTPDLSIVGTTYDGREIPVFVNGNFAF